ncbi:peptidase m20 [Lucifera butyrica]|uniref:Peptidase m20 n=1 Tax=Lucifera butyrica TaxID=1351585 RepID=A0A498R776_9FIRM|nr:amidohydrolase [Lucifera butyrica]VBB04988.1 peptidase m20 [Lucifera butyrica]
MTMISSLAQKYHQSIIDLRRHFHTYPELSTKEFKTQERIMKELAAIGLVCRPIAKTGVIAEIKGSKPGKTVAIRADMDALELFDECGKTYQSQNPGICHACGHDGHTAMLIGTAKILTAISGQLAGNFRFLFQPSEEILPGGAQIMIEEGALAGVDAIIGAHLWEPLKVGTIGVSYDRLMAASDRFSVTVKGRGGHGSMPHQTVDSLLVGAQLAVALNTIVSRNIDPLKPAVVSLGTFKAGETFNIIPDTAFLTGTVRSFEPSIRSTVFERIEQIIKGVCETYGAAYQFEKALGLPAVVNNPECSKAIAAAGEKVLGRSNVLTINPVMGGEDFSYYQEKIPGAFFFIGVGNPEKGIIYPQHHPKYDIDEDALLYGMEILVAAAVKLAQE